MKHSWLPLGPGDKISVIAPGMPFDQDQFGKSRKIIESWDLKLDIPKDILGRHPICANSLERRRFFIRQAINSESKVIWAARGGYGSLHLLTELQKIKKPKTSKLLVGFSDITTLHQFVNQEWGWPSLHGPHVDRLAALNAVRLRELQKVLFGKNNEVAFKNLKPMNEAARAFVWLKGEIVGGNLIVTQSSFGTPWQLETKGKILFFEELGERAYKVDRVLTHMSLLGMFKGVKAMVLGPFVGGDEPDGSNRVQTILKGFAEQQKFPIFSGLKVGHIPNSLSLPFNTSAELKSSDGESVLKVSTGVNA